MTPVDCTSCCSVICGSEMQLKLLSVAIGSLTDQVKGTQSSFFKRSVSDVWL